jgi:hypothetical protein
LRTGDTSPESEMKKKKRKGKKSVFACFQSPKVREKKFKNFQSHTCGFHCIAKHQEGSLKLCALFVLL